jgi:hypothetical protein
MQYKLVFHCNNGCTLAPQRYVILTFPASLLHNFYRSYIVCETYGLQLTSVFANCVSLKVFQWFDFDDCHTVVLLSFDTNTTFISIFKLYVSILYTNHLQTSYKTVRKQCMLCHILRVLLSHSFIFFRFYFLSMYVWFYSCLIM